METEWTLVGRLVKFWAAGEEVTGRVTDLIPLPAEPGYKPVVEAIILNANDGKVHQRPLSSFIVVF